MYRFFTLRRSLAAGGHRTLFPCAASISGGSRLKSPLLLSSVYGAPAGPLMSTPARLQSGGAPQTQRPPPADIPLCEWNNIHETDVSKGYLLRATYASGVVHLTYTPQSRLRADVRPVSGEAVEGGSDPALTPVPANALVDRNKRVLLILPTPFLARMLGVLDGTTPSVEIVTRTSNGTFTSNMASYTFELSCESTVQNGEKIAWSVTLTPGEAIMMQRFFSMALERNFGFTNYVETSSDLRRRAGGK